MLVSKRFLVQLNEGGAGDGNIRLAFGESGKHRGHGITSVFPGWHLGELPRNIALTGICTHQLALHCATSLVECATKRYLAGTTGLKVGHDALDGRAKL